MKIKTFWRDQKRRWQVTIAISFFVSIAFTIYNGLLGFFEQSIWHGSICIYCLLLLTVKSVIWVNETRIKNLNEVFKQAKRLKTFYVSSVLLFLINLALIAPITLMVLNRKQVILDEVAGITMATYTTYKIVVAIIQYHKYRKNTNLAMRQIRTINLIDAILSILTLQNTLICIYGSYDAADMFLTTAISSFAGIVIMMAISIISFVRGVKENKISG